MKTHTIDPKYKSAVMAGDLTGLHPNVSVDIAHGFMTVNRYSIDLERISSTGQALDHILQIAGKSWCDPELAGQVVYALMDACRQRFDEEPQAVLCPCGNEVSIDWQKGAIKVRK